MLYLSPVWHTLLPELRTKFGYMQNLHNGGVSTAIHGGHRWMLDNGAFSDSWNEAKWIAALELWQPYTATCIAAVCPDVVADSAATLARFQQYAPIIRCYGYSVAFVTQDGLQMADVPWNQFEVLFVGGTTHHKLKQAWPFITEAHRRNKWVHIGRVNSISRIKLFSMADSADGTTLSREPSIANQYKILSGVAEANGTKGTLCFTF